MGSFISWAVRFFICSMTVLHGIQKMCKFHLTSRRKSGFSLQRTRIFKAWIQPKTFHSKIWRGPRKGQGPALKFPTSMSSCFSSTAKRLATSPVFNMLSTSSRKDSSFIWVSVRRNTVFLPWAPTPRSKLWRERIFDYEDCKVEMLLRPKLLTDTPSFDRHALRYVYFVSSEL